jgi:putative membrane protein
MWALFAINAVSIFGYATFTLHPELLARYPWSPPIYAVSYPLFARLQILLGFWLCAQACHKAMGWRWLNYFVPAFLISFLMEFGGTSYGIPFGKYEYTGLLGWKIADKVPLLIPVSWFCMSMCCYLLAAFLTGPLRRKIFHAPANRWQSSVERVALAALLLIAWDFTLEPAMSQLTPYWVWEEAGVFVFGVAVRNLMGWLITGLLIFTSYEVMRLADRVAAFQSSWPARFYLLNLFLPVGLSVAGAAWAPVLLTAIVLGACCVFSWTRGTLRRGLLIRGAAA